MDIPAINYFHQGATFNVSVIFKTTALARMARSRPVVPGDPRACHAADAGPGRPGRDAERVGRRREGSLYRQPRGHAGEVPWTGPGLSTGQIHLAPDGRRALGFGSADAHRLRRLRIRVDGARREARHEPGGIGQAERDYRQGTSDRSSDQGLCVRETDARGDRLRDAGRQAESIRAGVLGCGGRPVRDRGPARASGPAHCLRAHESASCRRGASKQR